jgi:predicted AlkP superfamily phosphohydrolase/phosphomutase
VNSKGRLILVGLDGMPFGLVKGLAERSVMPNTKQLIDEGVFCPMASSIPEISSVAWSSIITGENPGAHGVFGFTDLAPSSYRLVFPNFSTLKAQPFWEREGSGRSVILNVPSTFPARALAGAMISGFVALDLERATYPPALVPWLQEQDYRVDVNSELAHKSLDLFLEDLDRTLRARIRTYRHLWTEEDWDTFVLVFTGTDRLAHFLWDAYEDEEHRYHDAFLDHLRQVDVAVGEIAERTNEDDVLLLLSDHGFERLESDVYVNHLLLQEGFLRVEKDQARRPQDIADESQAFALDPGRIYVHLENRFPRGTVLSSDRDALVTDLIATLEGLEFHGAKVIERVYRREEIYEGPWLDQAPDLVVLAKKGFNLRGGLNPKQLFAKGAFMGKHSQPDAFLLIRSRHVSEIVLDYPGVSDIVSLVDSLCRRR